MSLTLNKYNIFLKKSSFFGLCSVYSVALSFENDQAFNVKDIFKDIMNNEEYCYGYIVACSAFELFDFNIKNRIVTVKELNPLVNTRNLYDEIAIRIEIEKGNNINSNWTEIFNKIDNYFH